MKHHEHTTNDISLPLYKKGDWVTYTTVDGRKYLGVVWAVETFRDETIIHVNYPPPNEYLRVGIFIAGAGVELLKPPPSKRLTYYPSHLAHKA